MNTKLFVGNLSFDTTENDLQDAFAAHGSVSDVNLITDRMSGRSRGFAFVTMGSPEEAQKAIEALKGQSLQGRAISVNEARPRDERSGGGGGGAWWFYKSEFEELVKGDIFAYNGGTSYEKNLADWTYCAGWKYRLWSGT